MAQKINRISLLATITGLILTLLNLAHPWVKRAWNGWPYGIYIALEICLWLLGCMALGWLIFSVLKTPKSKYHSLLFWRLTGVLITLLLPFTGLSIYPQKPIGQQAYLENTMGATTLILFEDHTYEIGLYSFSQHFKTGTYRWIGDTLFLNGDLISPRLLSATNLVQNQKIIPLTLYTQLKDDLKFDLSSMVFLELE
jgi:hypothetical protein